jgi:hypothetical protein
MTTSIHKVTLINKKKYMKAYTTKAVINILLYDYKHE